MKPKALLPAFLGCALWWTVCGAAAPPQQEVLQANDEGDLTLTQPTRAGDLILQPGTYAVQHRRSGGQDFIRFMQVEQSQQLRVTRIFTGWYTHTELNNAGEVKCRVEPLGAAVQATEVTIASEDGVPRIRSVMVKGKAALYIF